MDAPREYVGRSWRSRFLRAPKAAFDWAGRPDFVQLQSLGHIRLGLKTGSDKFFFLKRDDVSEESKQRRMDRPRGSIAVIGVDDWRGRLPARALLPAILNPHQFMDAGRRRFVVPRHTQSLYLFPGEKIVNSDLTAYVKLGERLDIHKGKLVQSNAADGQWYRQSRAIVTSRWALPYNSAYDYGPLDNSVGAVLNGRFIGVDPLPGVDADLLGAALATTFVVLTRLLEGVATGVEGAFDVGPPAARLMAVPDVRRIPASRAEDIREVLAEMQRQDTLPGAPNRDAKAPKLRHALDLAVLRGLGVSKGEASALVGFAYQRYARWRAAVEDVEFDMRGHRRAMSRSGQSRTQKPNEVAARRIWEELEYSVRVFPALDFDESAVEIVEIDQPVPMPAQESLMDAGVIHHRDGNVLDLQHYDRVRYAAMLGLMGHHGPLPIPRDASAARRVVDDFIAETIKVGELSRKKAAGYVPKDSDVNEVVQLVERLWLRKCRSSVTISAPPQPAGDADGEN